MRAIDELVEAFQGILRLKRHNPGNDMLTYMLEDKETTDVEHRDNIVTFFIAGHDTTAGAMSSLCYFMALYPNIQRRAREEVRLALASNGTGEPTLAELRAMPYLNACIRESLRFNTPLVEVVPRTCTRDTVLRAGNGQEVVIPAGASLTINVHTVHHREDYWDGASEFNPERFVGAGEGMDKEYDSTHWMSFGLGPRQCPARNFAMYEQRTLYAMLLNEWEWSLPEDSPHRVHIKNGFSPFALSLPKDLYVDFKRRV
ncbi:hypothetical protein A0H81_09551 [Grifola frondosa]|uniref:Cytochrome P450 n=1 Tax=Grifola frondosa TaxID=5627 RepID=A0A1C7M1S2_GRIFR|nr:hypothetical protein A0H81_09551 [Grifola frondosa]